ncbi:2TM domain-containing protein [Chryseobacterium schmidteae]|uniref:2TM domain-containing protein n=1 Tax=Chryseobacterium schmidteae TaxID=2730404 RepID=UPI00158B9BE9|nr:2TM domain-containing protein [Chryseobacterium schmidteae]
MENLSLNKDNLAYRKAAKRVKDLKGFYGNLTSYCLIIPFLLVINLLTSPDHLWFYWPMLGWGLGLTIHAVNTFGIGKNWEEKKIKQLMEEEKINSKSL